MDVGNQATDALERGESEDGHVAECTENNQHIVTGTLDMLEQLRQLDNGRMLRRQPALCNVLFLLSFATLRYDPMVWDCPAPTLHVCTCRLPIWHQTVHLQVLLADLLADGLLFFLLQPKGYNSANNL